MNAKPGAIVYATKAVFVENVGAVGRVIGAQLTSGEEGPGWLVEWCELITVLECRTFKIIKSSWSHHPDAWLRPIDGLPVTDDVEDEVPA